jgi:DNA-binding response OmpR family regulator
LTAQILIVDDDADLRETLQRFLTLNGFAVHTAADGNLASKILATTGIDLVITDIIMPDKDGFGLINEVRALHAGIRIIAISGGGLNASGSYLAAAQRLGADAIFNKPLVFDDLLRCINGLVETAAQD